MKIGEKYSGEFYSAIGRSTKVDYEIVKCIPGGNEADIFLAMATLGNKKIGEMIIRSQFSQGRFVNCLEVQPDAVLAKHHFCKRKGLSMPATFRYDKENKRYLITRIASDNDIVISNNRSLRPGEFEHINVMAICQEVKRMMVEVYEGGNGLILSSEAFTIIVTPQKTCPFVSDIKIMALDIFFGSHMVSNNTSRHMGATFHNDVIARNMREFISATGFVNRLSQEEISVLTEKPI